MSSCYTPLHRKILHKIPGLFKKCPEGNYHWFWDRLCFCRFHEYCCVWHGGIYDMELKMEYQPCAQCAEKAAMKIKVKQIQEER
jgi:hypothetical protein